MHSLKHVDIQATTNTCRNTLALTPIKELFDEEATLHVNRINGSIKKSQFETCPECLW